MYLLKYNFNVLVITEGVELQTLAFASVRFLYRGGYTQYNTHTQLLNHNSFYLSNC